MTLDAANTFCDHDTMRLKLDPVDAFTLNTMRDAFPARDDPALGEWLSLLGNVFSCVFMRADHNQDRGLLVAHLADILEAAALKCGEPDVVREMRETASGAADAVYAAYLRREVEMNAELERIWKACAERERKRSA